MWPPRSSSKSILYPPPKFLCLDDRLFLSTRCPPSTVVRRSPPALALPPARRKSRGAEHTERSLFLAPLSYRRDFAMNPLTSVARLLQWRSLAGAEKAEDNLCDGGPCATR